MSTGAAAAHHESGEVRDELADPRRHVTQAPSSCEATPTRTTRLDDLSLGGHRLDLDIRAIPTIEKSAHPRRHRGDTGNRTVSDDTALLQHHHTIDQGDDRGTVRHDDHRRALWQRPDRRDDALLGRRIDGRGRVVEHEHVRAHDECTRKREALALTS